LEDAVTKTKKILSANSEAGVNCECLMEDQDFSSNMNRSDFEEMCKPMMSRVQAVLDGAKAMCSVPVEQIDAVEIVGGAVRVPWVKKMLSEAFGGKDLSTTMNQEESVARGCALQAAILSPLYKVRDFIVEDCSPYAVNVGWMGSSADAEAQKTQDEDGDTQMTAGEGEYKTATVFPAGTQVGVLKMLTFYRKGPFEIKAEYADPSQLLPGTSKELGTFKVELPAQTEPKKIKVKAKLTLSGCFSIEGAQLVEEEEYEETVKEKRELPPAETEVPAEKTDGDAPMEEKKEDEKKEGEQAEETKTEKKEPEKKYEWVDVVKKKKRTKRTDLTISIAGAPGLSLNDVQKRMDEETAMQAEMRDIIETDEKRNDLEGYLFTMRDKIAESGQYGAFITQADREKFESDLMKAEDWLYDAEGPTKAQYIEKLDELKSKHGDAVAWRFKEDEMRADWIEAVSGTVKNYRTAAEAPGDKYGHIAAEKLAKIIAACTQLSEWLADMKQKQDSVPKTEKPVLLCADMEKKNQELSKMADEILKEPKPAPPKEEKKEQKEEKKEEATTEGEDAARDTAPGATEGPQNMDVD
jgi:molecular chaperone DnaK (HSP70)